jgi:tetratricopeptide (TPR) repeat protein
VALSKRRYDEAVQHFEKAVTVAPEANRIHYALAMAYRGLGKPEKAKMHLDQQGPVGIRVADPILDKLLELVQGSRVHLIRGKQALEAKRYEEAVAEFRKAIAARPDSVPAHVNLGAALIQLRDLDGAASEFEKTLAIDPNNANAHFNLAVLLANANEHQQAIIHLKAVSAIKPSDLEARYFLAHQLMKMERFEEALVEFSHVVQNDPNNEEAVLERVNVLQRLKQYKEAIDSLEQAHQQFPEKVKTQAMLAFLLATTPRAELRNGNKALKLAEAVYAKTALLSHGSLVAMALAELGRCDEASKWQRKLITAAVQQRNENLAKTLRLDLERYEGVASCRPAGDW